MKKGASERLVSVGTLALRAIEGAPGLTQGEIRELAQAVLDHDDSCAEA